MKKSDMWVALAASLGVGAATFYTMSKSQQPLNKAIENITPMLNNMVDEDSGMSMQNTMNDHHAPSNLQDQPAQNNMN